MSLLTPAGLLLASLAIPILILYMLKLRHREVQVSSTLLWQLLMHDRQANAPWQRIKRNLLLFLQLLILAALVFALARPALQVPSVASGAVVLLVDASASMQALDGSSLDGIGDTSSRTRFEAARDEAHRLVDNLPLNTQMTLILVARQPQILVSAESSKVELRQALESAQPTQGSADWEAAFALAAGAAAGAGEENAAIVVISDGGLPETDLPPLPAQVRFIPVGRQGENLAISALALRPAGDGAELFAGVTNYGDVDQRPIISFYADGQLFHAQQISLSAGQSQNVVLSDLPRLAVRYEAHLTPAGPSQENLDFLPLDDAAYATFRAPQTRRALLVSPGNIFLEQLLASLPGIQPFRSLQSESGGVNLPNEIFDIYILDGVLPTGLPAGNLLLINPPPNELIDVGEVFTNTANARVANHPLTEYLAWEDVHVLQARRIQPPEWTETLIEAEGGPLVLAGEHGGRRLAVVAFDLHDSDLPLQVAYPILFSNLINFLAGNQPEVLITDATGSRPGEVVSIRPQAGVGEIEVITPSSQVYRLPMGEQGAAFSATGELGFYSINDTGPASTSSGHFVINLFDPLESNIRPAEEIQVGRSTIPAAAESAIGQRELWPWLAGLALAVLVLEWWVYHRRQSLPTGWLSKLRVVIRKTG